MTHAVSRITFGRVAEVGQLAELTDGDCWGFGRVIAASQKTEIKELGQAL